ncbi:hypothetical protein HF086_000747 [Spodoptera exigua]|uniref:Gag-like protein n=1 Tax=Spodoptera exigua TaxID=7107 RepID=A0A922M5P0_SPOEX|nr:hypothetical protein HF086_000747 [Spodoptera exigua]
MSVTSAVSGNLKRLRKRPREGADSGSESGLSDIAMPAPRREAAAAAKAAALADKLEEDERQIAALTKRVTEGRVSRLSESSAVVSDVGVEAEDLPASDLNQRLVDAVAAIRQVSKVSKGLSGCSKKALKEATASILESTQVLLTRTVTEETALLRAQNKSSQHKWRSSVRSMRSSRPRWSTPPRAPQARSGPCAPDAATAKPQLPSQETELTRLIRKEMASFNARFSVLEGKILRPPLAADQRSTPTYAAQAATPRAAQPAPAAAATQKRTAASQMKTAGPQSNRQSTKEAKKTGATARPAKREPATRPEAEWASRCIVGPIMLKEVDDYSVGSTNESRPESGAAVRGD